MRILHCCGVNWSEMDYIEHSLKYHKPAGEAANRTADKKPREFNGVWEIMSWNGQVNIKETFPDHIHVIEHSAYAALKKENEELQEFNKLLVDEIKAMKHPEYDPHKHEKEIEELRADRNRLDQDFGEMGERAYKAEQENASLRESLKLAVEALTVLLACETNGFIMNKGDIGWCRETLAKITAKHTELD
jgi:FtsZ-binding cell division protein ZapB